MPGTPWHAEQYCVRMASDSASTRSHGFMVVVPSGSSIPGVCVTTGSLPPLVLSVQMMGEALGSMMNPFWHWPASAPPLLLEPPLPLFPLPLLLLLPPLLFPASNVLLAEPVPVI